MVRCSKEIGWREIVVKKEEDRRKRETER